MAKTEAQLIEETREAGRAFLRRKPEAFGGGIDPQTGVRTIGGLRVSVAGTGEVAGVGGVPTLEQARIISAQAAVEQQLAAATEAARVEVQRAQEALRIATETRRAEIIKEAARKQLRRVKQTTRMRLAAIIAKKLKTEEKFMQIFKIKRKPTKIIIPEISKEREALSFQSGGELIFKNPGTFARAVNRKTGSTSFTSAVPIRRQDGKLFVQDFNFRFDKKGNLISAKKTGSALLNESHFLQRDRSRSNRLLREAEEERAKGKILPLSIIPIPSIETAKSGFIRAIDFVSGGALTERSLNKKGEQINKDVESFNKRFGGKELSEAEFKQANLIATSIAKKEETLDKDRDKLARSIKSRVAGFLGSPLGEKRLTKKQTGEKVKGRLKSKQKELTKINTKIKKREKKKFNIPALDKISKFKLKNLKSIKKGIQADISLLEKGQLPKIKVIAGEFPIIPAISIPSGVTAIKFLGTQKKAKSGKIVTDIVFKTSKGRVGVARGVSVARDKKTASVVLGRSGKVRFKFPSAKKKLTAVRSFIGREVSIAKPGRFAIRTKINLLKRAKKIGTITKIKGNIQAFKQAGIGQVGSVKGKKFISIAGKIKKVRVDDFASISAIFTKKDLSLIIGKTITRAGAKSKFIGLIKGTSKAGKTFSIAEKQQFVKALDKIISATSAALTQTKQVSGLTKAGSLAAAARIAARTAKLKPKLKRVPLRLKPRPKPKPIPPKPKPKPKPIPPRPRPGIRGVTKTKTPKEEIKEIIEKVVKPKVTGKVITGTKSIQKARQRIRNLQRQRNKLAQRLTQRLTQKQLQTQRLRLRQVQKQINKLALKLKIPFAPGVPRVPRFPFIPKIKRKKRRRKAKRKPVKKQAYNVFARPLKKTKKAKRPKLIKVNKVPLGKRKAKDLRNYILDTSLSRTGKIKKAKGRPKKSRLRIPKSYAKRTTKKFRRHRIVKGKRKLLPKGKVIEKRKHLLDTRQERRKITLRRRIKQITKKPRRIIRRSVRRPIRRPMKISPVRRRQMLSNLAKARRVRASNLKRSGRRTTTERNSRNIKNGVRTHQPIRIRRRGRLVVIRRRLNVKARARITGIRKQQMLSNLAKARRVRASNLRRGKRR